MKVQLSLRPEFGSNRQMLKIQWQQEQSCSIKIVKLHIYSLCYVTIAVTHQIQ
uniref:Uncharacterized protein n=1 Tax=Arundo donax TaxID=35708 RepID=A0A0A9AX30_ARUDO